VMMHIAFAIRLFSTKLRKYDRTYEAIIVCRKIVLVVLKSNIFDMDCNEAKIKKDVLQVKKCSKVCL